MSEQKDKITILHGDAWEGFYKNGKLICEDDQVQFSELCRYAGVEYKDSDPRIEILIREGFEVEDIGEKMADSIYTHLSKEHRFPAILPEIYHSKEIKKGSKVRGKILNEKSPFFNIEFEGEVTDAPNFKESGVFYTVKIDENTTVVCEEPDLTKIS